MKKLLFGAFASLFGAAFAIDGSVNDGGQWISTQWNNKRIWSHEQYAADGGIATFNTTGPYTSGEKIYKPFDQNVTGLTLGGIYFNNYVCPLINNGITFTGEKPFISSTHATGDEGVAIAVPLTGTGTLEKKGKGHIYIDSPVQGFSKLEITDGTLAQTNNSATATFAAADVPIELNNGTLKISPKGGAGEAFATRVENAVTSKGSDKISVAKGSASSAQVTFASISQGANSLLVVNKASGSEKIFADGRSTSPLVNEPIVCTTADKDAQFAAYSEADGFVAVTDKTPLTSGADVTGVASVTAATTIDSPTRVDALEINSLAPLTITGTLTVGDGVNGGKVLVNGLDGKTNKNYDFAGPGTLAFGDKPGIFVFDAGGTGNTYNFKAAAENKLNVTGTSGVTFAGVDATAMIDFAAGYKPGWSGGTTFNNVIARFETGVFAEGDDVTFLGNASRGAMFMPVKYGVYSNNFHFAGIGTDAYDGLYATKPTGAIVMKSGVPVAKFERGVELVSNTQASTQYGEIQALDFNGKVYGGGDLTLKAYNSRAVFTFAGTNEMTGDLNFLNPASDKVQGFCVKVKKGSNLGSGTVTMEKNVYLSHDGECMISNKFVGTGNLLVQSAKNMEMQKSIEGESFSLESSSTVDGILGSDVNVKRLNIGGNVTAKAAAGKNVTLTAGGDEDFAIGGGIADGAGTINFVKEGSGTVDMTGRAKTYTGKTVINGGTLRLVGDITNANDIAYWLDASDAGSYTIGANGVSEWRSKVPGGIKFVGLLYGSKQFAYPEVGTTDNGKPCLTFSDNKPGVDTSKFHTMARLVAEKAIEQRTVFIVCRPRWHGKIGGVANSESDQNGGIFGSSCTDTGIRGINDWSYRTEASGFTTSGKHRINGGENIWLQKPDGEEFAPNQLHMLTAVHDREEHSGNLMYNLVYNSSAYFLPSIGGYFTSTANAKDSRNYNGDICEVIAFKRVLSESEMRKVENYLSNKWMDKAAHESGEADVVTENMLAPGTGVEIISGATLDLNGINQTVASLKGTGSVIDSSGKGAKLTVTGAFDFRGNVGTGVTIKAAGAGDHVMQVNVAQGATLEVAGGSAAPEAWNEMPVTNGLSVWVDASYMPETTILRDSDNRVTNWLCRAGASCKCMCNNGIYSSNGKVYQPPVYVADGLNGKPALYFSGQEGPDSLWTVTPVKARTVFLVMKRGSGNDAYIYGPMGDERCSGIAYDQRQSRLWRHGAYFDRRI